MTNEESNYWSDKNTEAHHSSTEATVRLLKSLGFKIEPDGDHWGVVYGECLATAPIAVFEKSLFNAVGKATSFLYELKKPAESEWK